MKQSELIKAAICGICRRKIERIFWVIVICGIYWLSAINYQYSDDSPTYQKPAHAWLFHSTTKITEEEINHE